MTSYRDRKFPFALVQRVNLFRVYNFFFSKLANFGRAAFVILANGIENIVGLARIIAILEISRREIRKHFALNTINLFASGAYSIIFCN